MRKLCYIGVLFWATCGSAGILLTACNRIDKPGLVLVEKMQPKKSKPAPLPDTQPEPLPDDTVRSERLVPSDNGEYLLAGKYYSLNDSAFASESYVYTATGDTLIEVYYAHNYEYIVSVSQKNKALFHWKVSKNNFRNVLHPQFLQKLRLYDVKLFDHVAHLNYFIFKVEMGIENTELATDCFAVLNDTGAVLLQDEIMSACSQTMQLSPDKKHLITCKGLYNLTALNTEPVVFNHRAVAMASFINDSAYTVVYDFPEQNMLPNLFVYRFPQNRKVVEKRFEGVTLTTEYNVLFSQNAERKIFGYFDNHNEELITYTWPHLEEKVYKLNTLKVLAQPVESHPSLQYRNEYTDVWVFYLNQANEVVAYYRQ